ncbi:MAG: hypothetical protein R3B45_04470 [Bdellovibrionota bacterium]
MALKTIHYKISGLDYVYVRVPVTKDDDGEDYIDFPMGDIEEAIAVALIKSRVPLRGAEVIFLRKALGHTLKSWADALGLSAAGVLKWERATKQRLSTVNEAAVRAFCAEELGVELPGVLSQLVGKDKTPKRLSVKLEDAA